MTADCTDRSDAVGYSGATTSSLHSLVTVAGDYMTALGRTLRHTVDRFANEMTSEVGSSQSIDNRIMH
jgi:hypothetical protein